MSIIFTPQNIGSLTLPNRLVRSATAERFTHDADGRPQPQLASLYRQLTQGGVGLIITGHMYVHPTGKAHPEMTGIYADDLLPDLTLLADAVHQEGGKVAVQINHGGMQCSRETVPESIAPSAVDAPFLTRPAREMTVDEIAMLIDAYAQAARRTKEAGFDGVQLHAAHGYLISQFLSPFVNKRTDNWGGSPDKRLNFLRAVYSAVREQVGPDYPVFAKLGFVDGVEGGLTPADGLQIVAEMEKLGLDAVEISGGIQSPNSKAGLKTEESEAYFRPFVQQIRAAGLKIPLILVGGLRSKSVMENVLTSGDADFVSLCRPLINQPDLPNRMRQGVQYRSGCISGNRCWPKGFSEGISCKCAKAVVNEVE